MSRRKSVPYSYLTDPNSLIALDKEKNAKLTAEKKLLTGSNSNHIRLTSMSKNIQQLTPPASPRALMSAAKAMGSTSFTVQHRRRMVRESLMDISKKEIPKWPGCKMSTLFDDDSSRKVEREACLSSRKVNSNYIAKPEIKNADKDDGKPLEAVCYGDYLVDDISSYSSEECGTEFEYQARPRKDAQTQTPRSGGDFYQIGNKLPYHKAHGIKRTETCQVKTTTLYPRRSLSDTSLRRTKRSPGPSTSSPQFAAESAKVYKQTTTTEHCIRPSTSPPQFFAETTEFSKCTRMTGICSESTSSLSVFGTESTELCTEERSYCHYLAATTPGQPPESLAKNQLIVPESIRDILKPLECNFESTPRCTVMTRGIALSLAASFLLFLGLLWTGISVSLATYRIATHFLYPVPPDANQLARFLRSLSQYLDVFARWLWYNVLY